MGPLEIALIAIGVAMDAFAVSLGIGCTGCLNGRRPFFRIAFHFGLFQAMMPVLGWLAGTTIAHLISSVDHWIALVLLAFVGIRMIRSGLGHEAHSQAQDPSRGGMLIVLCVATSIDAFAVGLSFAMLRVEILLPVIVIGVVTGGLSLVGLLAGKRLGEAFGKRMEILGGIILLAIGLRILFTHLAAV